MDKSTAYAKEMTKEEIELFLYVLDYVYEQEFLGEETLKEIETVLNRHGWM